MKQAKKGGEIGKNQEFYKGGQFLPSTELPKRESEKAKKATHKEEIAPYKWEVQPTPTSRSIFNQIAGREAKLNRSTGKLEATGWNGNHRPTELIQELIDLYNSGTMWIDQSHTWFGGCRR